MTDATESVPAWRSIPLPDTSPVRRRNVARLRAMGGKLTCVPPDFNSSMLSVWEKLWQSMPQSGKINVTVNNLLQQYRKHCRAERKRPRPSSASPPALLPVSFALVKDWLLRQQKAQSEAIQAGAVNEEAREVVAYLNRSLAEQPATTAALLDQPVRPASLVVPTPVMSLGPEPVTDKERAEERAEKRARRQLEERHAVPSKKRKAIPPELEERQQRASARMQELSVPPLQQTAVDGKRRCPVCHQLRTNSDKTPDGQIHRVLGRSNRIWCPYADDPEILESFEREQKERKHAAWKRANEVKRLKKQQLK